MRCVAFNGVLLFSHLVTGNTASDYFASFTEAQGYTSQSITSYPHRYSILSQLQSYASSGGLFYFMMLWPGANPTGGQSWNAWSQSSNPMFATAGASVTSYTPINLAFGNYTGCTVSGQDWCFSGLRKSLATTSTLLDAEFAADGSWWMAIGQIAYWGGMSGAGIPGPFLNQSQAGGLAVNWVQLWICKHRC